MVQPGSPLNPETVFQSTLLDLAGQPNLYFGSAKPNQLNWRLTNNATKSGPDLVVTPFVSGPVSPTQYHFSFNFAPGALTAVPSVPGWSVAAEWDSHGAIQTAYLAAETPITLEPQASNLAEWTYTTAIEQDPNNSRLLVTITAGQNVTLGGVSVEGKTYGPVDLTLVPAGAPALSVAPVSVDFVGRRTVLNDGKTRNSFTFALTNMTSADLVLTPQQKAVNDSSPSVFTVWFDAAPNNQQQPYPWALAQVQDLDATFVQLTPPSTDWIVKKSISVHGVLVPGNPQWALTVSSAITLAPQSPLLFTFSGIVSDLDPGFTRMYLRFQNLGSFTPGALVAELEKSPLVYGSTHGQSDGKIGIGTIDPKNKLHIGSGESTITNDRVSVVIATKGTDSGIAIAQEGGALGPVNLLVQASGAGAYIGTTSNHPLVLRTGDADRVNVDTDGKVHVAGSDKSSDAGITIAQKDGVNALLQVSPAGACIGTTSSHPLVLKTSNADQVSIDKDGTFTAKSTKIAGQLSVTGPVSMFGSYQGRQVNSNYVAATDGIVCALITGPNRDEISDVRLDGMVNGQLIGQACGFCPVPFGEVCFPGSLAFPVPKGANWEVKRTDDPNNQTSLTVAVFWMPIGATQISADDKPVAEFTNMSSTAFKPREDLESAMVNLVDVLATVLKQSFTGEERAALVDAIKRLI